MCLRGRSGPNTLCAGFPVGFRTHPDRGVGCGDNTWPIQWLWEAVAVCGVPLEPSLCRAEPQEVAVRQPGSHSLHIIYRRMTTLNR